MYASRNRCKYETSGRRLATVRGPALATAAFVACAGLLACPPPGAEPGDAEGEAVVPAGDSIPIERTLERVAEEWMRIPGVAGTGLGLCDGRPCIVVFATRPADELDPPVPPRVDGHPVRVELSGPFRARRSPDDST